MLNFLKNYFASVPLSIEDWAQRNSTHTDADDIIAAAIVQSFVKDFDKWTDNYFSDPERAWDNNNGTLVFKISKAKIRIIKREVQKKYNSEGPDHYRFAGMTVDGIPISNKAAKFIVLGWEKIATRVVAANTAADKAKEEMNKLKGAWDLVEDLLGLTRNEHGALVPKEPVQ